jgi:F-type H+-transporting ATPase subunit b
MSGMTALLAAGGGGNFPPFDTTTFASQLFWLAIVFGALYYLMSTVIVPRIGGILDDRASRIAADLAAAEKAKAEADASGVAFEKSLTDARNNAAKLASDTREKMNASLEASKKTLEAELSAKITKAESAIAETKAKAMASVKDIAAEAADAIITQVTGKTVSPDAIKTALSKFA